METWGLPGVPVDASTVAVLAEVEPPDGERERVLRLLRAWGWNATAFQVTERGFRHFFDGEACVSYVDTGRAWVVAGAPICAPERIREVTTRVLEAARQAGRRVVFFGVERRFVDLVGMPAKLIGLQATWDPRGWGETLRSHRSLREQLRRARAKGVRARALDAGDVGEGLPTRRAIEGLIERWHLAHEMPRMGFLVDVQPFELPHERRYYVAEVRGRCVGFLCAVPIHAREGWLFEDFLRDPLAPNGTIELLVDRAMRDVAESGATYVTLGLAPLAGGVSPWLGRARRWGRSLYDFDGVRAFKAKLRPSDWAPIFMAFPEPAGAGLAIFDTLTAFARGNLLRFGLRGFLRGPAFVVRILALLLVPWVLIVALASPEWFPSPAVRWAWVGVDAGVAIGLLMLARMWRQTLALALAFVVTASAVLTLVEAASYDLPRWPSLWPAGVVGIAFAGPFLAAIALWGAIWRRARARRVGGGGFR